LKNKTVLLTGACGVLGREFSKSLLDQGARVVLADINEEALLSMKQELIISYDSTLVYTAVIDITDENIITTFLRDFHNNHGEITTLVNNAYPRNKNYGKHFFEVKYDDFCENIGLNLGGYFLMSQKYSEYIYNNQLIGNIVNISSVYGVIAPKFEIYKNTTMTMPVEYSVIKSGLIHLTKYMAKYFKGKSIRVNSLSPGGIFDNQEPAFVEKYNTHTTSKGMLDASDLSGALIFLVSDESRYVNGQNIIVDDGFTL